MFKDVMSKMNSEVIFSIISLLIFFSYFMFLLWDTLKKDKEYLSEMENMPLKD